MGESVAEQVNRLCSQRHHVPIFAKYCPICGETMAGPVPNSDYFSSDYVLCCRTWQKLLELDDNHSYCFVSEFNQSIAIIEDSGWVYLFKDIPKPGDSAPPYDRIKLSLDNRSLHQVVTIGEKVFATNGNNLMCISWLELLNGQADLSQVGTLTECRKIIADKGTLYVSTATAIHSVGSEAEQKLLIDFKRLKEELADFSVRDGVLYTLSTLKDKQNPGNVTIMIRCNGEPGKMESIGEPYKMEVEEGDVTALQIEGNAHYVVFRHNCEKAYHLKHSALRSLARHPWKFNLSNITEIKMLGGWVAISQTSTLNLWRNADLAVEPMYAINNVMLPETCFYSGLDQAYILYLRADNNSCYITTKSLEVDNNYDLPNILGDIKGMFVANGYLVVHTRYENRHQILLGSQEL